MKVTGVSVQFEATIPTQPYGNIVINVKWDVELGAGESPEAATQEIYGRIREQVVAAVKPVAEAKRQQVQSQLKDLPKEVQNNMIALLGAEQWLMSVAPETRFAATTPTPKPG